MPHIQEIQKINVQSQPSSDPRSLIQSKNPQMENWILSKCEFTCYLLE